jgi:septal ring-binding cell division protein DamX
LKTLQINKGGKTKFVIIYGSFANADLARKSMRTLPSKYRKSWVRAFDALKQEIK